MSEVLDIGEVLPEEDASYLREKHPRHTVRRVGGELHVLIHGFSFPDMYLPQSADLLLRLPSGYPNAAPDMFWTNPTVKLKSGTFPAACQHHEVPGDGYADAKWQRWSRHFQGGWIVGRHGLQFFVATIRQELKKGV